MLLYDGDQLQQLLVHCFGSRVSSILLLCSKKILCAMCTNQAYKKVRNITGKTLFAKSCFKFQENLLVVDLMINGLQVFEILIGTVCMPLSANMHQHLTLSFTFSFFLLAV